jgi:hypothetical protein
MEYMPNQKNKESRGVQRERERAQLRKLRDGWKRAERERRPRIRWTPAHDDDGGHTELHSHGEAPVRLWPGVVAFLDQTELGLDGSIRFEILDAPKPYLVVTEIVLRPPHGRERLLVGDVKAGLGAMISRAQRECVDGFPRAQAQREANASTLKVALVRPGQGGRPRVPSEDYDAAVTAYIAARRASQPTTAAVAEALGDRGSRQVQQRGRRIILRARRHPKYAARLRRYPPDSRGGPRR